MCYSIYKWVRRQYHRDSIDEQWRELEDETTIYYITESWRDIKTGEDEKSFFENVCDSTFKVERDEYGNPVSVESIRNDGLRMFRESFEEMKVHNHESWRESEAIKESSDIRTFPVLMDNDEHLVIRFGKETTADYNFMTNTWVG